MNKDIELIYMVTTRDPLTGDETICAVSGEGLSMQAASGKKNVIEAAYEVLKRAAPDKDFVIATFRRMD